MPGKTLIIGAKGGLGRAFMELNAGDEEVVGLDRGDLDIANEADVARIFTQYQPKLVINCAAYNSVDKAEEERAFAENINGYAPGFLAHACAQANAVLVHYSTGQVFNGKKSEGYAEDDITNPINAYGASKLLGEIEVQKNTQRFYIIRTAWLYGNTAKKSFIDIMLEKAAGSELLRVVDDEFGTPTYVKDLAAASKALIEENKPFGIYHLTNAGMVSRFDWAKEIFRIKKMENINLLPVRREELERTAARPQYEYLINTKYIQLRPWTEALEEYLKT